MQIAFLFVGCENRIILLIERVQLFVVHQTSVRIFQVGGIDIIQRSPERFRIGVKQNVVDHFVLVPTARMLNVQQFDGLVRLVVFISENQIGIIFFVAVIDRALHGKTAVVGSGIINVMISFVGNSV